MYQSLLLFQKNLISSNEEVDGVPPIGVDGEVSYLSVACEETERREAL